MENLDFIWNMATMINFYFLKPDATVNFIGLIGIEINFEWY
jgi:hypothetical protein